MKRIDYSGQRFGLILIVDFAEVVDKRTFWNAVCDCGTRWRIRQDTLRKNPVSCGCLNPGQFSHGHARRSVHGQATSTYRAWNAMRSRCLNERDKNFPDYGGRGITVCERWNSFENFLSDMGERPSKLHSLGRKDNNSGYSPSIVTGKQIGRAHV